MVNFRVAGVDLEDAERIATEGGWIADLAGEPPNIRYLFPYLKTGSIQRSDMIGVIPFISSTKETAEVARKRFMAATTLVGSAKTAKQFGEYLQEKHWLIGSEVSVIRIADVSPL